MPTSSNGKDNHSGQHLRTLEPEPPSSSARRESPSRPRTTTPDVVASLASRHNHRSPNPRLRPPLPQRTDGRNQRSRSPSCKRFSHLNQSAAARHLRVENHQKKYPQPHRRNVAEYFGVSSGSVFGPPKYSKTPSESIFRCAKNPRCSNRGPSAASTAAASA